MEDRKIGLSPNPSFASIHRAPDHPFWVPPLPSTAVATTFHVHFGGDILTPAGIARLPQAGRDSSIYQLLQPQPEHQPQWVSRAQGGPRAVLCLHPNCTAWATSAATMVQARVMLRR